MPRQQERRRSELGAPDTPQLTKKDPSLLTVPTTSVSPPPKRASIKEPYEPTEENNSRWQSFKNFLYDRKKGTVCDRTYRSWIYIIMYSIFYLIFLMTYTLIFLYGSLMLIKSNHKISGQIQALVYSENRIGLSATPTSVNAYPIIWYRDGNKKDYTKYITAIDNFLANYRFLREGRENLGPCGQPPYGYGEQPCVIIRINKLFSSWTVKPLRIDSPDMNEVPDEVKNWIKTDDKKLWLHCEGYHAYDRQHIRGLRYHPHPPGFDSTQFPLGQDDYAPLVAVQVTNFTKGISIAINCKLFFESGTSFIDFLIYVGPTNRIPLKMLSSNISYIDTHK